MPTEHEGAADPARKTAGPADLTRKLADVAQNVVITMHDCGTTQGVSKRIMYKGDDIDRPLSDAIRGRVSRNTIAHPTTGALLLEENQMISPAAATELEGLGIDRFQVRSPMTCQAPRGVCRLCYGTDPATGSVVEDGAAVGISAARAVGASSQRLTTHAFHAGGLRRVVQLFEARRPRNPSVLAEWSGRVRIPPAPKRGTRIIEVVPETGDEGPIGEARAHQVPVSAPLRVQQGEHVKNGEPLVHGTPDPHEILRVMGEVEVQEYLVREVQLVYRGQRINIDDKHIEIIVARMFRTVKVYEPGDTDLLRGAVTDRFALFELNRRLTEEFVKVVDPGETALASGRVYRREEFERELAAPGAGWRKPTFIVPEPAVYEVRLLGITEAAARGGA